MSTAGPIAFLGATGGSGLATLKHALAAGRTCIALCRTPEKLTTILSNPNLLVKKGDALSVADVSGILVDPSNPNRFVDAVASSIGGVFDWGKMAAENTDICRAGMATLLESLAALRAKGVKGYPRLSIISTTGITEQRDVPVAFLPLYHLLLKAPHVDKAKMEKLLVESAETGGNYTLVRPSLLTNGGGGEEDSGSNITRIRVGVENPVTRVRETAAAIGYTISRNDVGCWIWENVLRDGTYKTKAVCITY